MSAVEQVEPEALECGCEPGDHMIHLQHPTRKREAWCGAPVIGHTGRGWTVDCVVCMDLLREYRRWRRSRS